MFYLHMWIGISFSVCQSVCLSVPMPVSSFITVWATIYGVELWHRKFIFDFVVNRNNIFCPTDTKSYRHIDTAKNITYPHAQIKTGNSWPMIKDMKILVLNEKVNGMLIIDIFGEKSRQNLCTSIEEIMKIQCYKILNMVKCHMCIHVINVLWDVQQ